MGLTFLASYIGNMTNLTYLNLSDNRLITLPNEISNLVNLTALNLNKNALKTLPNTLGILPRALPLIFRKHEKFDYVEF
jgi:Leucine-rich repeat (LRR) protein